MPLQDVHFTDVHFGIKGDNPLQVTKNIAGLIGRTTPITRLECNLRMEELLKTSIIGIGDGVVVFDWVSEKLSPPYLACFKLEAHVPFPALDDKTTDIVLALISPEHLGPIHLQYLSRMTRLFREPKLLRKIRNVDNADGIKAILAPENRQFIAA